MRRKPPVPIFPVQAARQSFFSGSPTETIISFTTLHSHTKQFSESLFLLKYCGRRAEKVVRRLKTVVIRQQR
jgi:hypothetical protein